MIVALAGGVGGARLAVGLAALLPPDALTIVVNTGDDFEHLGLSISPDLDTVMYTLAGLANPVTGWGRVDETWSFMETLGQLGGETWFSLGDRDLAVHALRTHALKCGAPLSGITRTLAQRMGIEHPIVPMSDHPVRTVVLTDQGELAFQDYFVRLKCEPAVSAFRYRGSDTACAPAHLVDLFASGRVRAAIICPSNPFISIEPILTVADIRRWLEHRDFPVVAVSPIVGGQAIKGPAAKMMHELGLESSAAAIARHYGAWVDGWVIDEQDAALGPEIESLGKRVAIADTLMSERAKSTALAQTVLGFADELRSTGKNR